MAEGKRAETGTERRGSGRSAARPKVSAIVTCVDAADHIGPCLESLSWCDEILVVDSYSKDATPRIAERHPKVRLFQRRYYGAASQKNWALDRVRHEWVIILDVDERCTPALRDEIESLLSRGPRNDAYTIRRRAYFLGKPIRFSGWRKDRVVRLFRKGTAYYQNRRVHSKLVTSGPAPWLSEPMDHFMVDDFTEYARRLTKYGYWGAAQLWKDGRRAGPTHVLGRPLVRFLRTFVLQGGFLDGMRGLVFCLLQSYATYCKWSILWSWGRNAERGLEPALPEFDEDRSVWNGLDRVASPDRDRFRAGHQIGSR